MGETDSRKIWVIGHKNPDTDAICAAITYANLKNQTDKGTYEPKRCGNISNETKYVLDRFDIPEPELVTNAGVQIKDTEYRQTEGVSEDISLKDAWDLMKTKNVVTLPVIGKNNKLDGIIVLGDLAYSYMAGMDPAELSRAETPYKNIIETIEGEIAIGDRSSVFSHGKVVVAAGNHEAMAYYIDEGDMVILGGVEERQLWALKQKPGCLIITGGDSVSEAVAEKAREISCNVLTTNYDSFTVARLINQSIPVRFFMTTGNLVSFSREDYINDIKDTLAKSRHRSFPIVDTDGKYVGMFSRRHLMHAHKKQIILVDHNEFSQAIDGITDADVLEIIDHHRIGGHETHLPVFFRNQPLGCSNTIIYQMYREKGVDITPQMAGVMLCAILSDTLMFQSPTCTPVDEQAGKELAEIAGVDYKELAMSMFEAGSDFAGKMPQEILFTDFKVFAQGSTKFGVSQVSAVSDMQLKKIKDDLSSELRKARAGKGIDLIYVMLTNIITQESEVIYDGEVKEGPTSREVLSNAFGKDKMGEDSALLPGVVSRKKQMVPSLLGALLA